VEAINRRLQALLNPPRETQVFSTDEQEDESDRPQRLRAGDRVMQTVNDYDKDVSNGDVGRVASVDPDLGEVIVRYDGRSVSYLADEARQLVLAYAITIHKSQGSEYPAVVIPLHTQHYVMLQRNLLYTALTRGRRLVCLVGSKAAIWRAVRNSTRSSRSTALEFFLRKSASTAG
ncbi:ATP-binding domain-containing protein, partial [Candidatus Sumerlaeota bacterium]|nr:ATP-binding domain-containing protein [Candidatus Sumerlaeota bacterium]